MSHSSARLGPIILGAGVLVLLGFAGMRLFDVPAGAGPSQMDAPALPSETPGPSRAGSSRSGRPTAAAPERGPASDADTSSPTLSAGDEPDRESAVRDEPRAILGKRLVRLPAGLTRPAPSRGRAIVEFDERRLAEIGAHAGDAGRIASEWDAAVAAATGEPARSDSALSLGELEEIRSDLRENLEDSEFDRAMYAAQQPNRALVTEVIPGRAASRAGLRPGDVILSVGEKRIFDGREARSQMMQDTFAAEESGWRIHVQRGDTQIYIQFIGGQSSGADSNRGNDMPGVTFEGVIGIPE